MSAQDTTLEALKVSLAAKLPHRYVQRSLVDPANASAEQLKAGLICLVNEGGGAFANWQGREGELGNLRVRAVCFVQVAEDSAPVEVEQAELALLGDLLSWFEDRNAPPLDCVYPGDWAQSRQLEHPYGWLTLALDIRNV